MDCSADANGDINPGVSERGWISGVLLQSLHVEYETGTSFLVGAVLLINSMVQTSCVQRDG